MLIAAFFGRPGAGPAAHTAPGLVAEPQQALWGQALHHRRAHTPTTGSAEWFSLDLQSKISPRKSQCLALFQAKAAASASCPCRRGPAGPALAPLPAALTFLPRSAPSPHHAHPFSPFFFFFIPLSVRINGTKGAVLLAAPSPASSSPCLAGLCYY